MWKVIRLNVLFLTSCISVYAQDVMIRKNGDTIEGKVIEVGIDRVTYKINNDLNGASFVIRKSELKTIEFANGQIVLLNYHDRIKNNKNPVNRDEEFGRNMINFSPFKALDSGPGIGISYEILLDKRQYFGVVLPVSLIFPDSYNFYDNGRNGANLFYFSPGFKVYPFGQRKVTYAVGPNLFTAIGKRPFYGYDPVTGGYTQMNNSSKNFRLGVIVNNYINFQITPSFQIGLNGGIGARYIDREKQPAQIINNSINVTGEFNFNLGFRF
ncbi:hypothetical protein [Dyadobacter sp. NIV53]|uniref:hypothetical protein n=1 Tax=Dyadobacter sp. NIV53 TaxID=2861765 RepID=UPI001C8892DA|nr:hypothetical protein [Dyadobacter sp. NIV53]